MDEDILGKMGSRKGTNRLSSSVIKASVFEISCENTDTQTNSSENLPPVTAVGVGIECDTILRTATNMTMLPRNYEFMLRQASQL